MIVHLAARARRDADRIDAWLRQRSPAAADRFRDEVAEALQRLAVSPHAEPPYSPGIRRLLLRGSRYHLYYDTDDARGVVTVRTIWHAARSRGPKLGK